jgi:type III secretory pathway lipoprotein EscJ
VEPKRPSFLNRSTIDRLVAVGVETLEIPIINVVLKSAFGQRTDRIKKQVYLEFELAGEVFEHVLLLCSRLVCYSILGSNFALECGLL